jgi:hypothetical protein
VTNVGKETVDTMYTKGKLVKMEQSNGTYILLPADVESQITSLSDAMADVSMAG